MKEITIGDKSLMQISKEDILQLAVMQGCCAHLDFWNYPTLLEYDNAEILRNCSLQGKYVELNNDK